eukprot:1352188-Rhodomonas_salina.2
MSAPLAPTPPPSWQPAVSNPASIPSPPALVAAPVVCFLQRSPLLLFLGMPLQPRLELVLKLALIVRQVQQLSRALLAR